MRDFCLSVSLCLAAVAAMLSACLLLSLIDHSPAHPFNLPLPSAPHHHFRELEKWLSHVRLLRYQKGCDPLTPRADLPDLNLILSPALKEKQKGKQIECAVAAQRKKGNPYINVEL